MRIEDLLSLHVFRTNLETSNIPCSLQFSSFIMIQVKEGRGRLRPGFDADAIIKGMFDNQDRNGDGRIVEAELHEESEARRDEL